MIIATVVRNKEKKKPQPFEQMCSCPDQNKSSLRYRRWHADYSLMGAFASDGVMSASQSVHVSPRVHLCVSLCVHVHFLHAACVTLMVISISQ